jgi:hypothetical protein
MMGAAVRCDRGACDLGPPERLPRPAAFMVRPAPRPFRDMLRVSLSAIACHAASRTIDWCIARTPPSWRPN